MPSDSVGAEQTPPRILSEYVAGLLTDHIDRRDDKEPGDMGENRGVDYPEPPGTVNPETAIDNGIGVCARPHAIAAGRVMAPGFLLNEFREFLPAVELGARDQLPLYDSPGILHYATCEEHAFHHCVQVLLLNVGSFTEVAEHDLGWITGVRRPQPHVPAPVNRMALQDRPGEVIALLQQLL